MYVGLHKSKLFDKVPPKRVLQGGVVDRNMVI